MISQFQHAFCNRNPDLKHYQREREKEEEKWSNPIILSQGKLSREFQDVFRVQNKSCTVECTIVEFVRRTHARARAYFHLFSVEIYMEISLRGFPPVLRYYERMFGEARLEAVYSTRLDVWRRVS